MSRVSETASGGGPSELDVPPEVDVGSVLAGALRAAVDGVALVDADRTLVYANRSFARMHGYAESDLVGRPWRMLFDDQQFARVQWRISRALDAEGHWQGEVVGRRADDTAFPQSLSVACTDDGGFVSLTRDISGQKEHERQLAALNRFVSELVHADGDDAIAAVTLRAVEEVLGYSLAELRRYDPDRDALVLLDATEAWDVFDPPETREVASSHAGRAYRAGEPVIWVASRQENDADALLSQTLYIPLGEYGVLGVGSDGDGGFERSTVELGEILGASVSAALDRAARERELAAAREELRRRHEALVHRHETQRMLLTVSILARDIVDAVIEARSREDIERTVCERLASSELYHFAWIGEYSADHKRIIPRAGAGVDEGVLDAISDIVVTPDERGAIDLAIETGNPQVVRGFADADRLHVPVRQEALARGFGAALAVPINYRGRNYGALVVIASHPDAFGEFEQATFSVIAQLVGFAVRSVNDRDLLYSDTVVRVELSSRDEAAFFAQASRTLGCRLSLVGMVPEDAGFVRLYALIEGASASGFVAVAEPLAFVTTTEVINDGEEEGLVSLVVTEGSLVHSLVEGGARIDAVESENGESRVVFELPSRDDARSVVEGVVAAFRDSTVLSIREHDRPMRTRLELQTDLVESLTEKQRSALRSAYLEGYYDWPRRSNAAEIAGRLGISSATFHQHLRHAERKLLQALLK